MHKSLLSAALCLTTLNVNAALSNGDNLSITSGAFASGETPVEGQGSWVSMEVSPGNYVYEAINGFHGINLGTAQPFPPDIDMPWTFFGGTGLHLTTSPANVLGVGGSTATVDFSGWGMSWDWLSIQVIDLSSGAWGANADGVSNVTCFIDCSNGDGYSLDYTATVPIGDPSGFGGLHYALHLEGFVNAVPIPSAVWLFGSGIVGLIGVSRRKARS